MNNQPAWTSVLTASAGSLIVCKLSKGNLSRLKVANWNPKFSVNQPRVKLSRLIFYFDLKWVMFIALTLYNYSTAQEAFVAAWAVLIWECHLHRSNLKEQTTCSSPCTRPIKCLPCITTCASCAELGLLADSPIARMTFHGLLMSKGYSSMHGLDAQRRLVVHYPLNSIAEGSNLFDLFQAISPH